MTSTFGRTETVSIQATGNSMIDRHRHQNAVDGRMRDAGAALAFPTVLARDQPISRTARRTYTALKANRIRNMTTASAEA